ncbi:MAG: hypothetical protein QXH37_01495 [Candidatus Bathyarchaeia archaeon]
MREAHAIRCPRCGAYVTEEITKDVSYVKCPYCNATLLIPKNEASKGIQHVIVLTREKIRQIKKYGKTFDEMNDVEAIRLMVKEIKQERVAELECKKKKEGLTAEEERELASLKKSKKPNLGKTIV